MNEVGTFGSVDPIWVFSNQKKCPACTESQSKTCRAWRVARDPTTVLFGTCKTVMAEVALKVGKVRIVAEIMTPQLPAPPPRRAKKTIYIF
jgi:hypothetical protein